MGHQRRHWIEIETKTTQNQLIVKRCSDGSGTMDRFGAAEKSLVCFLFQLFLKRKILGFFSPTHFLSYMWCSCALYYIYLHGMVNCDGHRGIHLYVCMSHVNTQKTFISGIFAQEKFREKQAPGKRFKPLSQSSPHFQLKKKNRINESNTLRNAKLKHWRGESTENPSKYKNKMHSKNRFVRVWLSVWWTYDFSITFMHCIMPT